MGPGSALPQYLSTPPRPPDPSNFGLYGGSYSRSDCYRLQGTHQFHSEFTQFSSQPSYPPPPPSETIINGYVFPHQFPHLSANCTQLSANAPPPPPPSSAHHYHFQSYHFQQPTPPTPSGHYPPPPPIVPIPQDTPHHPQYSALHLQQPLYQYQPPALIGHPTTPLSPLPPYHVASVYPNPQHELLNPPVNYPHSDSSISHHQTQSKATIISQSTLSSTYGSVFSGDRDGTPTTKRLEPIRVNQNLRIRSQILRKRKPLSKLARRSRTRIHGDSKMDRCGALLTTSAEPDAFYVLVETSPTRSKGNSSAFAYTECQNLLVSESTPKHLKQKTHMVNQVDMLELNSQLMQLVKICNVKKARKMFDKRPKRDAVSWTSMISGYVRVSDSSKALALFSNMWVQPGLCMDPFLLSITLRACGLGINLSYGEAVHVYLAKSGIVNSVFVGIALLDLYMKVVGMEKGCIVFDKMLLRNVVSGTTIITGEIGEQVQIDEDTPGIAISTKGQWNDKTLDSCQPSQADWIKRYVEQQEEDESSTWEDDVDDDGMGAKAIKPRSYDVIAKEYYAARLEAAEAKQQKDKKNQERAGKMIRDLKQELAALGLSDDILASEFEQEQSIERAYFAFENTDASSKPYKQSEGLHADELKVDGNDMEQCSSIELPTNSIPSDLPVQEKIVAEEETTDMEIGNFFLEDAPSNEFLTPTILELQKKEKFREMRSEKNLEKLDGIWKKGDPQKIPKVIFQQLCQKSGWEAAKFNKVRGKDNSFSYTISVLRKASGRGESRRAGGLVTLQLPDHDVTFNSAEDAQNRVEAYALCQLFPDLPIHLVITEPYDSPVVQWKEGETITNVEDSVKDRRATFLDSLLKADGSTSTSAAIVVYDSDSLPKVVPQLQVQEPRNAELNPRKDAESSYLRQELENKHKKQKFKEMLKARVALPIAGLKGDILQLLQDNNVLVVCGETGSGKTTQVPQFILDDMIQSGRGGHCNIICTQPWRIATISVADRVADESCEPSPGSNGSLVGYQVRLDNASNEKTKLLFCTTEGRTHPVTTSYDKKHTEREFGVGDWVYLKLQPYKQHSMHKGEFHKLSQMYYRPFQVVERVGKVAYILQLPVTAKIHDVFHVSLLKKKLGNLISTQPQLPHIIDPENPKWEPFAVLDRRVLKKRGAVINQWLVQWLGTTPDEATWEDVETILLRYLQNRTSHACVLFTANSTISTDGGVSDDSFAFGIPQSIFSFDSIKKFTQSQAVFLEATLVLLLSWFVFCLFLRCTKVGNDGRSIWFRLRWWVSRLDVCFATRHWLDDQKMVKKRKTELGGMFSTASWILFIGLFAALLYQIITKRSIEVHNVRASNAPDLALFNNDLEFNITAISSMSCSNLRDLGTLVTGNPGFIDYRVAPLSKFGNYSCQNTSGGPRITLRCNSCQPIQDNMYISWQFIDLPDNPAAAVGFQFNLTTRSHANKRHLSFVSGTLKNGSTLDDRPVTFRGSNTNILKFSLFPRIYHNLHDLRLIQPLFHAFVPGSFFNDTSQLQASFQRPKDGILNTTLYINFLSDYIVEIDKQNIMGPVSFLADLGGLYCISIGIFFYLLVQCEFRIKKLRNEDSVLRTIRNRQKAQVHWDKLRKYVMYTWNCKALDDYYESTNHRSGCTGCGTQPIHRNGTSQKRMHREADTISFNRELSLHNKKTVVQECLDTVGDVEFYTSGTRVNPPESSSDSAAGVGPHLQSELLASTRNGKQQGVVSCEQDSSLPKASSLTNDDIIPPPPSLELKDPAEMDMSDVQKNLKSLYSYNVMLREKLVEAQSLFHSLATNSSTEVQT